MFHKNKIRRLENVYGIKYCCVSYELFETAQSTGYKNSLGVEL